MLGSVRVLYKQTRIKRVWVKLKCLVPVRVYPSITRLRWQVPVLGAKQSAGLSKQGLGAGFYTVRVLG